MLEVTKVQLVLGADHPLTPKRTTIADFRTMPDPDDERFSKNFTGTSRHDPCMICGKEVAKPTRWVHIVDGGGVLLHVDDEQAYQEWGGDAGDMGWMPIGPDCYREYKERLAGFVHGGSN
jgi:hypothetical protein